MKNIILAISILGLVSCDDPIKPGKMYSNGVITSDYTKIRI